jgi:hypothetical protein
MRRPDVFTLDYSHPLAQGLVFAGLGQNPGTLRYQDESFLRSPFIVGNYDNTSWGRSEQNKNIFRCNGSNQYAELTSSILPAGYGWGIDTVFSFSVWARPLDYSKSGSIFSLGHWAHWRSARLRFLGATTGDPFELVWRGSNETINLSSSSGAIQGEWHHICGIGGRCESLGFCSLWLDGKLEASNSSFQGGAGPELAPISLGCWHYSTIFEDFFAGEIADPIIHNRALSPSEIALLADRTDPMLGGMVREYSPVVYFDLGAGPGHELLPSSLSGRAVITTAGAQQVHGLTSVGLAGWSGLAGVGVVQTHLFGASDVFAPSGVSGAGLGQGHVLAADGLAGRVDVLGVGLAQEHMLLAEALVGAGIISDVELVQGGVLLLAPTSLVGRGSVAGAGLSQSHGLGASGLVGVGDILAVGVSQTHALGADGLAGMAALDVVGVVVGEVIVIMPASLIGTGRVDAAALSQIHTLAAEGVLAAGGVSGATLAQAHELLAASLTGRGVISGAGIFGPRPFTGRLTWVSLTPERGHESITPVRTWRNV